MRPTPCRPLRPPPALARQRKRRGPRQEHPGLPGAWSRAAPRPCAAGQLPEATACPAARPRPRGAASPAAR
eukprot:6082771-Lingulodinium_polyedra.AAC.1